MSLDASLLAWLRCFDAAAKHLSFTRAAAALNVSQGAVSQQIRNLEERLRCKLFLRSSGGLELTPNGRRFAADLAPAFRSIETAVKEASARITPLHVSCSPSFALRWLLPRLSEFVLANPEIDLKLQAEFEALDRERFERSSLDVAIRYDPFEYNDLHAEVLMDEFIFPVSSPAVVRDYASGDSDAFKKVHTVLMDANPWDGASKDAEFNALRSNVKHIWQGEITSKYFNMSDLALSAALRGDGVAIARLSLVSDQLSDGRLQSLTDKITKSPARYILLTMSSDEFVSKFRNWIFAKCHEFQSSREDLMHDIMSKPLRL